MNKKQALKQRQMHKESLRPETLHAKTIRNPLGTDDLFEEKPR